MAKPDLTTPIKDVSDADFQQALQQTVGVNQQEAAKLVRMYNSFNTSNGDETLGDVLENLEVDDDIEVRKGN